MSLKIRSWRKIIKWTIWSVVAILFLVFLIRVIVFEHRYYSEKEGSERLAPIISTDENLIEEEPSEDAVREYTVAPDRPRYLTISALGIKKARVLPMGVKTNGELATPNNIFDVGWYDASGKPGQGGTMIIDGHNGGPTRFGVFKKLPELKDGDIIEIERGDGIIYKYSVVENEQINLANADAYMSVAARSPDPEKESVTLISCSGEWSDQRKTYLSRQFVRALIVEE